jgi:putative SOS response-associated peptidase YedK
VASIRDERREQRSLVNFVDQGQVPPTFGCADASLTKAQSAASSPVTSFCEYADTKPRKTPIRFALAEERPLFAFAGLRTRWRGMRGPKSAPVEGEDELFRFLTTAANAVIAPIHPKAMTVILTTPDEFDRWLEADTLDALALQRPLADDALRIVAKGEKEDGVVGSLISVAT